MKTILDFPFRTHLRLKFDRLCYYLSADGLFRGPTGQTDYPREKEKGEIRVLCIGDSTMYGLAVRYDKCWPHLPEGLLRDRFPRKKIRVLNAGIPGVSSRQVKRVFQLYTVNYSPDIVIWRIGLRLTDTYEIDTLSSNLRSFIWRCLYESRIFRVLCVIFSQHDMMNYVYDLILVKYKPHETRGSLFPSDFSIVKKIASEYGIQYTLAVDYLHISTKGTIIASAEETEYAESKVQPTVYTHGAFLKE